VQQIEEADADEAERLEQVFKKFLDMRRKIAHWFIDILEQFEEAELSVPNPRWPIPGWLYRELKSICDEAAERSGEYAQGWLLFKNLIGVLGQVTPGSDPDVPKLIEALGSNDSEERANAAKSLGDLEAAAQEAVPALTSALEDEDSSVRCWAGHALGIIGSREAKEAVPRLIEMLRNDENIIVRRFAVDSLGFLGKRNKAAIAALVDATGDEDGMLRGDAAFALGLAGARSAFPIVIQLLEDPEPWARHRAAEALGFPAFSKYSEAVGPLVRAMMYDECSEVRLFARQSLHIYGGDAVVADPSIQELLNRLDERQRRVMEEAIWSTIEFPS
jgi:HEAT repeat protein